VSSLGAAGPGPAHAAPGAGEPADGGDPIEHLWAAAHEFLGAFRAMIDAADAVVLDQQRKAGAPRARGALRRIDVE
jgi:hypothetical protein